MEISGGHESKMFSTWIDGFNDPNMYRLAHFTYGFNPGVLKLTGIHNDDERLFGSVTFGFGTQGSVITGGPGWRAAAHTDVGLMYPSVYLNDVAIELQGKYVHPDLVKRVKQLKVPGY